MRLLLKDISHFSKPEHATLSKRSKNNALAPEKKDTNVSNKDYDDESSDDNVADKAKHGNHDGQENARV